MNKLFCSVVLLFSLCIKYCIVSLNPAAFTFSGKNGHVDAGSSIVPYPSLYHINGKPTHHSNNLAASIHVHEVIICFSVFTWKLTHHSSLEVPFRIHEATCVICG